MPRYIIEPPTSVKDTETGTIWYTCDTPEAARHVADSHNRVQAARAAGCTGICGKGPGSADCTKCWTVVLTEKGIEFRETPNA